MSEDCRVQIPVEAESATVGCSKSPPVQNPKSNFDFVKDGALTTFLVKLFPLFYLPPLVSASRRDVLQVAHCCISPPL